MKIYISGSILFFKPFCTQLICWYCMVELRLTTNIKRFKLTYQLWRFCVYVNLLRKVGETVYTTPECIVSLLCRQTFMQWWECMICYMTVYVASSGTDADLRRIAMSNTRSRCRSLLPHRLGELRHRGFRPHQPSLGQNSLYRPYNRHDITDWRSAKQPLFSVFFVTIYLRI